MALSENIEYDKIEVVTQFKYVQVRKAHVIKRDDVEISRAFERYTLECGTLDASDNLVDNPLDKEPDGVTAIPDEVKLICNAAWTDAVKLLQKNDLIARKNSST